MKAGCKKAAKEDQRCNKSLTPHLPDHLLTEIFCRLPIKTLTAIKCVSKSCLELVSGDTHFAKLHRQRSPTELLRSSSSGKLFLGTLQLQNNVVSGIKRSLLFNLPKLSFRSNNTINSDCRNSERADFSFVNSCNGLLCFRDDKSHHALICNPVTDEFVTVPLPKLKLGCYVGLYSLGFSGKGNRYKLLLITYRRDKNMVDTTEAEICTLEKGSSWRHLGDCPWSVGRVLRGSPCLFFEGKLHLIFLQYIEEYIDCFDIDDEQFGKVPLPTNVDVGETIGLRVLGGRLSVTRFIRRDCIEIWVMKEYGVKDSWKNVYTFCRWVDENVMDCWSQLSISLRYLRNYEILKYLGNKQVITYTATLIRLKVALAGYEADMPGFSAFQELDCEEGLQDDDDDEEGSI